MGQHKAKSPFEVGEPELMLRRARTRRDRAMIVLLWRAGLRVHEAVNVTIADCEMSKSGAARIHVVVGKGGKQRFVELGRVYAKYIRIQIRKRKRGVLLDTRQGDKINTTQCRRVLTRLGAACGLKGRCHPHRFRHSFARDLHNEGFSVVEIQRKMGHSSLDTTQIYLEDLGILGDALRDKMLARD